MKSIGSPVKVGKMDATSYSSIASEFGVRGYPTIKLLKGDLAYNYRGPRTKDDIIEFAHRVSGALIRPLPSQQMFDHVRKRHRVFFVYIGGESPLKEKYIDAASELIVYTYFFSASEDVVPEYVTLKEIPDVLVFKDNNYFVYDDRHIKDASDMVQFINSILDGTVPAQGGDSILQRLKRIVFDAKSTIVSIFKSSPLMGCFLFGLPLGVISIMCYGIYTADTDGGYIEERYEVSKSEMENQEQIEENKEQESSSGGSLVPAVQEPKDVLEKKKD